MQISPESNPSRLNQICNGWIKELIMKHISKSSVPGTFDQILDDSNRMFLSNLKII